VAQFDDRGRADDDRPRVVRSLAWLVLGVAALCGCSAQEPAPIAVAADRPQPLDAPLVADLDGDGVDETVRGHRADALSLRVDLVDRCARGRRATKLSRVMYGATFAKIVDADDDGAARELAFELRAGAGGRGVQAKVLRFRAREGGCAVVRTMFSYPQPATFGPLPKGAVYFNTGEVAIRDFDKDIDGLELRTIEKYQAANEAGCCPSLQRTTFWRLNAARDGYRRYETAVRKLRAP
jgi:hypothetical protein